MKQQFSPLFLSLVLFYDFVILLIDHQVPSNCKTEYQEANKSLETKELENQLILAWPQGAVTNTRNKEQARTNFAQSCQTLQL